MKKATSAEVGGDEEDAEASSTSKEHVIEECREHMRSPGKGQLLLSMLGVALSQGARTYLKKTDEGLKHCLSQYPLEFKVDGVKGREYITFIPTISIVISVSSSSIRVRGCSIISGIVPRYVRIMFCLYG